MATTSGPTNMKIHKKTGAETFILYHPQTGADVVLYNGSKGLPWSSTPSGVVTYTSQGVAGSTGGYYLLEDVLKYMAEAIDDFGGVLEFKGSSVISDLPTSGNKKGEVWVITNSTIYWRANSTDTWQQYPQNTLFVCTGETGKNYIAAATTEANPKEGWVPLGGNNDVYAKKTEAIGSVTYTGSTFTFSYVSGGIATTFAIPTIGTVAASTSAITTSISSASSTKIPTEGAVYNFAASAGQVKVTAATQGYLIGVQTYSSTDSNTARAPLDFNIPVSNGDGTATLGANISGNADTATQVNHDFILEGRPTSSATSLSTHSYNGSATVSLQFSANSFLSSFNSTNNRLTVNVLPTYGITVTSNGVGVQGSNGITVDSNGVSVKASTGIIVNSSGVGIKGAHTISAGAGIAVSGDTTYQGTAKTTTISLAVSGVSTGVYSALQIDPYGRAIAGAQSLVFAPSLQSADLSALVVGGLAFIGADETGNNSSYSAPDGTVITSSNIS